MLIMIGLASVAAALFMWTEDYVHLEMKMVAFVKNWYGKVAHVFTAAEAFIKTTAVTVVGGGITAVVAELHKAGSFVFSIEHLVALKAQFLSGAFTSFVLYLADSPAFKKKDGQ